MSPTLWVLVVVSCEHQEAEQSASHTGAPDGPGPSQESHTLEGPGLSSSSGFWCPGQRRGLKLFPGPWGILMMRAPQLSVGMGSVLMGNEGQIGCGTNFLPLFLTKTKQCRRAASDPAGALGDSGNELRRARMNSQSTLLASSLSSPQHTVHPGLQRQAPPSCHLRPPSGLQLPLLLGCPPLSQVDDILFTL